LNNKNSAGCDLGLICTFLYFFICIKGKDKYVVHEQQYMIQKDFKKKLLLGELDLSAIRLNKFKILIIIL
jgi:hypothetical protein